MVFLQWVNYPHMNVCVHRTMDNGFFCSKYVGEKKVMGVTREFATKEELQAFLLKQPSVPVEEIEQLMKKLNE